MEILYDIWSRDDKYARSDGIQRCWRKEKILPLNMKTEINNEVERASISQNEKKTIAKDDLDDLCNLMGSLSTKAQKLTNPT